MSCEFLRGRHRFIRAGSAQVGPNERPPFGCALLIWAPLRPLTTTEAAAAAAS
jgi:hypothetical protein